MNFQLITIPEQGVNPKAELIRGHVAFAVIGQALSEKYQNAEFMDAFFRYEYAAVHVSQVLVPEVIVDPETGEEVSVDVHQEKIDVQFNVLPGTEGAEPVTILYFAPITINQTPVMAPAPAEEPVIDLPEDEEAEEGI